MSRFLIKKGIRLIFLLVLVSIISYFILVMSPIDPIRAQLGPLLTHMSPEQKAKIVAYWGLDRPMAERFIHWMTQIFKGDLGISPLYRKPVLELIRTPFANTFFVMMTAWILSGVVGFALGVIAAIFHGRWPDRLIKLYAIAVASSPKFWLALLVLMFFSGTLGWFPQGLSSPIGQSISETSFLTRMHHRALPAFTLSLVSVSDIIMHTRIKLLDVLQSDYVLFARANGKTMRQIIKSHGIRNILLPCITLQFLSFSELFGGAVFIENIFALPGLGNLAQEAGLKGDMSLLLGIVLLSALWVFFGNFIADLLYVIIDPRMKGESHD